MGIISVLIILFMFLLKSIRNKKFLIYNVKFIMLFLPVTFFFIIMFWPYVWHDPINNTVFAFSQLFSANFSMTSLYLGKFILSQNAPWHYPIVWIFITTPVVINLLFLLGFLILVRRIVTRLFALDENLNDIWRGENEMIDIYFLSMVLLPVFLFINKGVAYDGWRVLYFIYPSIILIALFGIYNLNLFIKTTLFKFLLYITIILNLTYLGYWNYKYHPHQYVYFNFLFKNTFNNNFEKDYWAVSNRQSLNYIINNNKKIPIKIATKSFALLETSLFILNDEDKNKIIVTHNIPEAEFVITNYRVKQKKNFFIDKTKYKKYYEIIVDNVPINTVYRKTE